MPRISELNPGLTLTGPEAFPADQGVNTVQLNATQLAAYVVASQAGLGPNKLVKLDTSGKLPAVDGSALTNINITGNIHISGAVTAVPPALGTSQCPVHLLDITAENLNTPNIVGFMTRYLFGGSTMQGNRFAAYDFIGNTTPSDGHFNQFTASYSGAYTNVGDSGIAGVYLGTWNAGNDVVMLDAGAGLYNFEVVGREIDIIVNSAAGAKNIFALNLVSCIGRHAADVEGAIIFGASTLGGVTGQPWNYLMLCSDANRTSTEFPVGLNTTVFGSQWVGGGQKPLKTFADLQGFDGTTGSGFIIVSSKFSVSWNGDINCGVIQPNGSILPQATNTFDLGNSAFKWRNVVVHGNISADGLILALVTGGNALAATGAYTVATLPSAATGWITYVTDGAASLAPGAILTGGGSSKYLVWWNGANWKVIGN